MKKRIYIAGKISGENRLECIAKFDAAQKEIEAQGYIAMNPIELVGDWDTTWELAMRICICYLVASDAIVLLEDWKLSKGAQIERQLAEDLGIVIVNYTDFGLTVLNKQMQEV